MKSTIVVGGLILGLSISGLGRAAEPGGLWERDTLTHGFGGLADRWSDKGLDVTLGLTDIYQHCLDGGIPVGRHTGRNTGSYDLQLTADLKKLLGICGATLYTHVEGSWGPLGLEEVAVGSYFNINYDVAGRRVGDVTELWYEQALLNGTLRVRIGKLDMRGGFECRGCPVSFDGSAFANDHTSQFLNYALVNDRAIPFPDLGLGAIAHWNPIDWWYASAGAADADGCFTASGFKTTFDGDNHFFYVVETGMTPRLTSAQGPLQGAYRFGIWYDPRPKAHSDAEQVYRDDVGFYFSGDQVVVKEADDPNDTQGLGVFLRYGWASEKRNDLTVFWSAGVQYQGMIDGRDDDVAAVGFAHGTFSNLASATYTADHETAIEAYYNAKVTGWLNVTPGIQYIANPGGDRAVNDVWIVGIRAQMAF